MQSLQVTAVMPFVKVQTEQGMKIWFRLIPLFLFFFLFFFFLVCVCCFLLLLFLVWWWWCFGSILFLIVPFSYLNHREAQHECQAQSKSMPDTVLARSLQAIYDCESASAGFASLVDFTSIVVVLILS